MAGNNRNLRGRISGNVELHGFGHNRTALGGSGSLHLRDANIYELPVMISMLKILSIKAPDPNAFSQSDIDFRIEGEHVYFDKLDFKGDAISLLGKGEMNFQGDTRHGLGGDRRPCRRRPAGAAQLFFAERVNNSCRSASAATCRIPTSARKPFPA